MPMPACVHACVRACVHVCMSQSLTCISCSAITGVPVEAVPTSGTISTRVAGTLVGLQVTVWT